MEPGRRLGRYEIVGPLGAGGMGEVYRARDANLGREIAIKVLPAELADDPERLARFDREARLLASLNHPNVATVHGFEEADGVRFLAMELVEGETLEERIVAQGPAGPDRIEEILAIGAQIAEGLEAAHEAGIVHRDLKPANVKTTADDQVKILDFGLAKAPLEDASGSASHLTRSPTRAAATEAGWILGTAAYMSPEQARGKPVDRRADIWAFGCVMFEMLAGRPLFGGETATDVLAAIVREEPDWDALPEATPPALTRLLRRCLTKDPRRRLRDIGEARIELRDLLERGPDAADSMAAAASTGSVPGGSAGAAGAQKNPLPAFVAAALVGVTAGALAVWFGTRGAPELPDPAPVARVTIPLPADQRQPRQLQSPLAITRDGTLLAYVARGGDGIIRLYLRPLDRVEARAVPGSEGARAPFFSPDGDWVGFVAYGALRKARVAGGEPVRIVQMSSTAFGASWGPDGNIVYAPTINSGLWSISADGGEPEQLTQPDFGEEGYAHVWPQHLGDGRRLLYNVWGGSRPARVLDLDTLEAESIRTSTSESGGLRILPTGHMIYADREGTGRLLAAQVDLDSLEPRGQAVPVLDDVRYMGSQSGTPYLAFSDNGTAVYVSQQIGDASVLWVDRQGGTTAIRSGPEIVAGIRLAPDGRRAVFGDEQGGVWLLDLARGSIDVVVRSDELFSIYPIWHPDGDRIVVTSNVGGSWSLYTVDLGSRGSSEMLLDRDNNQYPASMSADGRLLAFVENHPDTNKDVWVLDEEGEATPIVRTPADESTPSLSPDGELIAYTSEESGARQVYVQRVTGSERLEVSLEGGSQPTWSRDGAELFFRRGDRLLSVRVETEPRLAATRPVVLLDMPFAEGSGFSITPYYDVSADGERFLLVSERPTTEFQVIFNWFEELRELVPVEN